MKLIPSQPLSFMDDKDVDLITNIADVALIAKVGKGLRDIEKRLLQGAIAGKTYEEIADSARPEKYISPDYLKKDIGPKLWKTISNALGEPVSKTNFKAALDRYYQAHPQSNADWWRLWVWVVWGRVRSLFRLPIN